MQQDHGKRLDDAPFYEIPELHNCQLQEHLWRPAMTDTIGCLGWQALEGQFRLKRRRIFLATFKKSPRACEARWRWLPKFFLRGLMYSYAIPPTDESSCVVAQRQLWVHAPHVARTYHQCSLRLMQQLLVQHLIQRYLQSLRYLLLQSIQLGLNRIACVLGLSSIAIEIDIALVVLIALYI